MEEEINLKKKIQLCQEKNSNKKLIRYSEAQRDSRFFERREDF